MKIQILVPHFKEGEDELRPLLDSIALQQSVDMGEVGVVIASDGPDAVPLSKAFFSRYPFEIKHVELPEHVGVSACRNAALDEATADYVMFCDADDMFCDMCGLHIVFREIDNGGFDTLISCFREETRMPYDRETPVYVNHDMDSTFVHGKVHNRKYLLDNGIRFNPALTIHEDSYFNILSRELADKDHSKYCPMPFYLWKWRDESVCRHDPDYILKTYNNMLDSNDSLVDEFVKRMKPDKANFFAAFMIFDAYYTMNKPEWLDKTHKDYRDAVEERFHVYFEKHRSKWDNLTAQEKAQISVDVRTRSVGEGMLMEAITIDQWLEKVSSGK